jgi:hypothetical protein
MRTRSRGNTDGDAVANPSTPTLKTKRAITKPTHSGNRDEANRIPEGRAQCKDSKIDRKSALTRKLPNLTLSPPETETESSAELKQVGFRRNGSRSAHQQGGEKIDVTTQPENEIGAASIEKEDPFATPKSIVEKASDDLPNAAPKKPDLGRIPKLTDAPTTPLYRKLGVSDRYLLIYLRERLVAVVSRLPWV